jgi:uncharacterized membrane protein
MKERSFISNKRSFVKALTFRSLILVSDSFIIFFITRRLDVALGVLIFSNVASTVFYFIHERVWNGVDFN